ncbi:hypothetical protein [Leptolyngbya sp. FACHB-16]|nr:hypothetical protein [Leptolyngbya sp. FACHB-16]
MTAHSNPAIAPYDQTNGISPKTGAACFDICPQSGGSTQFVIFEL